MYRRPAGAGGALIAPVLALVLALTAPASAAEFLGRHVWRPGWHGAGGYSALWLDSGGTGFVTLSDRGSWVRGRLTRDVRGAVVGVEVEARGPLLRSTGGRLRRLERDAEALARVDGAFYVAFESEDRVMRHLSLDAPPQRIGRHEAFAELGDNSGVEALAADAAGMLYAIPERSGAADRPFPVFTRPARGEDVPWRHAFDIPRDGGFLVTGADVGPDGRLYVLERDFVIVGFRSRLRSFDLTGGDERLEFESGLRMHDNLEGIAVWRDADGRRRATLISDDNLRSVQITEFVDYLLD